MSMANRTLPLTDRQVFSLFVDIPTDITSLRGGKVSVYFHNLFAVPFCLIGKHGNEAAPACISNRFGKVMVSLHTLYIQILDADGIISSNKRDGALMQIVGTTIGNLFVKSGNFELLVFKPSTAFLLTGKMLLCFSKFALVSSCVLVILKSFSLGSDKQVLQAHIHTNRLISLFKRSCVFFFCKDRNEILPARCLGNSYLTDFAFYLTVYTTLDTLLELGYEKPVISDRSKLRNGETIFGVLGFEVRELRTLLKEIGIGYFKAADSELQSLGIDIFKPCCCFMLLQCGKRFSLRIVVIALTGEPILFLALIEKVVVHKPSATEMPCQQIGLHLVRVQSELVCSINLSHSAYKVSNYFINSQKFMYICGMKENYNHENRHKYYLKCHLIFCIKYRRKILKGGFDDNIKAIFQSIADNSDFDIEIMETDKDHIHFLISYPPKLSVTSIVRKLKQESTVFSWRLYGSMLRKYFWKEKTLWSDGYFVCSIGEANPNTIIEYIRNQG